MVHINILHVIPHHGTLDVIFLKIGRGHNHNIGIHTHHEDHELFLNIVGMEGVGCERKDFVIRVGGDVMDNHIRSALDGLNNITKVFVKAVFLGIKDDLLVFKGEEAFIIRLFPLHQLRRALMFCDGRKLFHLFQLFPALRKSLIIDILFGIDAEIENVHLHSRKKVAADPVECHTLGDKESEIE